MFASPGRGPVPDRRTCFQFVDGSHEQACCIHNGARKKPTTPDEHAIHPAQKSKLVETQTGNGVVPRTIQCQIEVTRSTQRYQIFRTNKLVEIATRGKTKRTILENESRCTIKTYEWPGIAWQ